MKSLILIGGGGHCKSCIDVIEQAETFQIAGIVDIAEKLHQKIIGYEIIATDKDLPHLIKEFTYFLITIGHIRSPEKRISIFDSLKRYGATLPVIISPLAYVSKHARIKEGTIVMHHAVINADAEIGKNCIINTKALIEHDAVIEDHCHISTGVIINGGGRVGEGTFIGSNTACREYVHIGQKSIVGLQSRIFKNIPSDTLIY